MASFPDTLLDDDALRGARLVALALLADAAAERERLTQPDDPEALHDFRVAVRRLRSWLRAQRDTLGKSAPKPAQRRLRRLAQATNQARDAEVFAEWLQGEKRTLTPRQRVGANWLLRRLAAQQVGADEVIREEVERDFVRAHRMLESRLPLYRAVHHVHDGMRVATFAGEMAALVRVHGATLRRRLAAIRSAADDDAIHRARIAGKRLRYLIEPIAPHVAEGRETIARLKALQDVLGDVHDAHVWIDLLRQEIEEAAVEEVRTASAAVSPPAAGETPPSSSRRPRSRMTPRPGLLALIDHVRERGERTFTRAEAEWLGAGSDVLLAGVDAIVAALDARARSGIEIERKFLLRAFPVELPEARVREIDQGYLPGERLVERVRRIREGDDERHVRTVKSGTGITRAETEEACTREVFEVLWSLTEGRRVSKRRHVVAHGALHWEVDEFTDRDLVLAEIELPSPDTEPEIPPWLSPYVVREVTGDAAFVNANLAR